jgi:ERCC4-type nuclease
MLIIVDTREQKPWPFRRQNTARRKLDCGDYSLEGYENSISIERKSIDDLGRCLGVDKLRFESQLKRLKKIPYRAVIVEASVSRIMSGRYYSRIPPNVFLGLCTSYMCRFKVPFLFADNARAGQALALAFLKSSLAQIEA